MIFAVPGHIVLIRNGTKTQTRRLNRGTYQVGKDYAIQEKQGVKAKQDVRLLMMYIGEETVMISDYDARMEGGYTPLLYEEEFRKIYPKWDGQKRWVFRFCAMAVQQT